VILWFAGAAFGIVWVVFHDPAIDHRLVMAGALLPDVLDGPTGGRWVSHTLLFSATLLGAVMLGTRHRRVLRRQLLAVPIGTFLHLVLDGMWTDRRTFWWPVYGTHLDGRLPSLARGAADVPLELAGLAVLWWAWRRFRLFEPERRRRFFSTGRLSRDLV
jgi:hypothetical protein